MLKCLPLGKPQILAQHPLASVEKNPNQNIQEFRGLCVKKTKQNVRVDCSGGMDVKAAMAADSAAVTCTRDSSRCLEYANTMCFMRDYRRQTETTKATQ